MTKKINVLFVCMGNLCRSSMAKGVFTRDLKLAGIREDVGVDSAGTHAYQLGSHLMSGAV